MDFMKMLEEYKKFSNLSNAEKAEQTVEQFFAMKASEIETSRRLYQLSFMFDSLCKMLVEKGLIEKAEFDSAMEVADAKAKEKFDKDLAKAKEEAKSEILAELEKSEWRI